MPKADTKQIILALLLPMLLLGLMRLEGFRETGGECCFDGYYHSVMADLGPSYYAFSKKFPAMDCSVWKDTFSDKELGYHLILSGLRGIQRLLGIPGGNPFHLTAMFFTFLLVAAFVFTARHFGARHIWFWTLLMAGLVPFFTFRILMLRPHVASIAVMTFATVIFDLTNTKRKLWGPFLCGFALSWLHSNPHFILLPALVFGAVKYKESKALAALIPLAAGAGVLAGLVIHPQFPNTLIIWKVQCFDVVYRMMNPRPHIYLSGDYTPLTWQLFKWNWMVLVMFLLALGRMFVCLKKNETSRLSPATAAFFTLSFITVPGIILSVRAAEYAVPYLVITLALLQKDYPDRRLTALWGNVKWRRVIIFLLLPLLLLVFCRITLKNLRMKYVLPPAEYKGWLGKNAMAPGSKIANISWSDFPLLFYVAPDMVYTCGLDPLFGFRHGDGERFYKIEMFRIGRLKLSPAELADLLDARYVFAGADSSMLSAYMLAAGFTPVMSGKQGIIFDLRAPETKEKK